MGESDARCAEIERQLGSLSGLVHQLAARVMRMNQQMAEVHARQLMGGVEPRIPLEFRAQFSEDAILWELLGRPLGGFYVEAGAFDGRRLSVTYALEAIGWRGLLVEPNPAAAAACRKNRPHSRVVNAALGREPGSAELVVCEDFYGGALSHLNGSAAGAAIADERIATRMVTVPVVRLDSLVGFDAVDLAVIDTEGSELDVLAGFGAVRPRALMVEDMNMDNSPDLTAAATGMGYQDFGRIQVNRLFVRNDQRGIMERAAGL